MDEAALWDLMNAACDRMTVPQARLWDVIRISPEKWTQRPHGVTSGGFWAVALLGSSVVWYNDLENGFNRSRFVRYGEILEFGCNQDNLEVALQWILNELRDGYVSAPRASPPMPGEFPGKDHSL
jgi:hypothetical protein